MEQKDIEILSALLSGELQPEDTEVQEWVSIAPERQILLSEPGRLRELLEELRLQQSFNTGAMWQRIMEVDEPVISKSRVHNMRWIRYVAAAAVLIGCIIYWQQKTTKEQHQLLASAKAKQLPISNQAILKAGDDEVLLSGADSTFNMAGNQVSLKNGGLSVGEEKVINYTLTTPRGANYQVELPDGSRVWLNAASSITYPSQFTGDTREVTISGEAYFDIASIAAKPFIVKVGEQLVKVLGTAFNINHYTESNGIYTTLISGKVQVNAAGKSTLLDPGQQAVFTAGSLQTVEVDAAAFSSWKEGWIRFRNQPLPDILAAISRWYDVDIKADKQQITAQYFTCYIDKQQSLGEVINSLNNSTNQFSFLLQNGTIIVKEKF